MAFDMNTSKWLRKVFLLILSYSPQVRVICLGVQVSKESAVDSGKTWGLKRGVCKAKMPVWPFPKIKKIVII